MRMTKEQQLMIKGMDMLLRRFSKMTGDTEVTVDDIISASNEVYDEILSDKVEKQFSTNDKEIKQKNTTAISSELVTVYLYERNIDGTIRKRAYKAIEKKNSYEVIDCWRSRLSKNHDINKYTDTLHHAMWTDAENDELMEELLERY